MNKKAECPVCGQLTDKPITSALSHFELYLPGHWRYMRGNVRMFGFWDGFWGTVYLAFPFINTIRHWKHRRSHLSLPPGVVTGASHEQ